MAGSYNRVILVGNLTRDPETRYVTSGKAVTKFTLAVNNPRNKDETTFVDIVAWDKLGETCNSFLKKGMSALVEGRLVIRSYDDKDGNKRKATEVVIDNMQMLDRKGGAGGGGESDFGGGYANGRSSTSAAGGRNEYDAGEPLDDEIPF